MRQAPLASQTPYPEPGGLGNGTKPRDRKSGPLGISLLQHVTRSGISAVQSSDEWAMIDVTVDSGACATVMPSAVCTGISIIENDLSRNGVEY